MNGMERKGRSGMRYECNVALKRNAVNEAAYTAGKEQLNTYALHCKRVVGKLMGGLWQAGMWKFHKDSAIPKI